MSGSYSDPANWDLVPDAPDGRYYQYCCTVYDSSSGCHESVCDCAAWSASYPAQWVTNLAPKGNSTCNGCSISSSYAHPQVRWNECTPDPDKDEWYDRSTFSECYELRDCEDADSPFPSMQEGFSYGSPIHEYDSGLSNYIENCDDNGGQMETAYLSCHTWYRCKTRPGYTWDDDTGSWIIDTPGIPDGPTLSLPTVIPAPEDKVCPDCYEYNSVQDVCIYVGGEGCEEEPPCVVTAGCDAKPITGECIDRGDC